MTEIKDKSLQVFLDELASKSATPGGGSAAAVMGAQAAALISMVCNLTIGKPKYLAVETQMQDLLQQSETLRAELIAMIKADIEVFNRVMASYGLPKETETEKTERSVILQSVLKDATEVPLNCARACAKLIILSKIAADLGNVNLISDAGAALMAAFGALKTAALNVYINAASLKDRDFADAALTELETMVNEADSLVEQYYRDIKTRL